jgi:hypothetical protein
VIGRLEILAWFACRDLDEATTAFGDAVHEGHLTIDNDGDEIVGLAITEAGRALMRQTLFPIA